MGKTHDAYPPEFRRQMIALFRSGRTPEERGREFEPPSPTIRNWVQQAELDSGLVVVLVGRVRE